MRDSYTRAGSDTGAGTAIANGGKLTKPYPVNQLTTSGRTTLYTTTPTPTEPAGLARRCIWMSDSPAFGDLGTA